MKTRLSEQVETVSLPEWVREKDRLLETKLRKLCGC